MIHAMSSFMLPVGEQPPPEQPENTWGSGTPSPKEYMKLLMGLVPCYNLDCGPNPKLDLKGSQEYRPGRVR